MAKRRKRPPRAGQPKTITIGPHILPAGWQPLDWLVPYVDGYACIHHGHERADDHSLCGPSIFCCLKAALRYTELMPDSAEAKAEWTLTEAEHLAGWLKQELQVMYFVFCDPARPTGLLAIGLSGQNLQDVLYKRVGLEAYAGRADRLG